MCEYFENHKELCTCEELIRGEGATGERTHNRPAQKLLEIPGVGCHLATLAPTLFSELLKGRLPC